MKRYQCIKNLVTDGGYVDFKAGNIYEEVDVSGWPTLVDEYGDTWKIDDNLLHYFQELLDLNVDEHEEEEDRAVPITTKDTRNISWGCAICIAVFLTVLALIFFG